MNLETSPNFNSSLANNFAASSADSPGYFYSNGGLQMMQQHVLPEQPQQHLHHQQMPYPLPSTSPLFRLSQVPLRGISSPVLARAFSTLNADKSRRPRGEKRPIPDEQKDDKYFERRRRNNEAAKKSRDARKTREDELAMRARFLENDNSILTVQVQSMREELMKMRDLWVVKSHDMTMGRQVHQNQQQTHNSLHIPAQHESQNTFGQQMRSS